MKRAIAITLAMLAMLVLGLVAGRTMAPPQEGPDGGVASPAEAPRVLYWVAPMDPNYRRDGPGKSPMGMDLVPVYADQADAEPGTVTIDPTIVQNLGVRTATAMRGPLSRRIETVGYVAYDEDTVQHIHTRVDGWIEKLATRATGDPVRRGQLLFELYSPTLVNAQQEYLTALKSRNAVLREASRDRLVALGVTSGEVERLTKEQSVRRLVRVYAEADGYIMHLGAREGIFVTPDTEVMSIARLDRVWVLAEVFERQAAWARAGQRAEVLIDYLPGERWEGIVDYVYPELDPKTRTLRVRMRFDNEDERLRPNMFARVTLYGEAGAPVVHVPREALIRGGSVNRVVLALGDGRFRSQPVQVGFESGDRVALLSGIAEGERIVTSGQFLIDSEANIEAALMRMEPPGAGRSRDGMPMEHDMSPTSGDEAASGGGDARGQRAP